MPPRFAYWTILIDNTPTAFRAREQQELLPTVAQLKRTNDNVELKWFAHGKLWDSPEAQHAAERRPHPPREKRNQDWRPGGEHKDPRARFDKEAQRRKKREDRANWNATKPPGDAGRDRDKFGSRPPRPDRPWRDKPAGPPRGDRPWTDRPPRPPRGGRPPGEGEWRGKDRPAQEGPRPERKPWQNKSGDRPHGDRKPWQKPAGGPPRGDRPWQDKPRSNAPRGDRKPWHGSESTPPPRGDRKPWQKPAGGPPRGDRPWSGKPRDGAPGGDRPWKDNPRDGAPGGDRPWKDKPRGSAPIGDRPWKSKPRGGAPGGDRPWKDKPRGGAPSGDRPWKSKPRGGAPGGDRPWKDKPHSSDRPRKRKDEPPDEK